jgi:hypothetical protein
MSIQPLLQAPHITIGYDLIHDILIADWLGEQTKESVIDGCTKMLHYVAHYRCQKVMNDNTHVMGMWSDAAQWVALEWIPAMYGNGCRYLAHIYSPDVYSKLSADKAISHGLKGVLVATFYDKANAESWLKVV